MKPGTSDDPDKPRKGMKTGDSNYIGLWLALLMLSAGALASAVIYRRKRLSGDQDQTKQS